MPLPAQVGAERGLTRVFSIPGGTRALTADLCDRHNVPMATFDAATEAGLRAVLPDFAHVSNPTDLTGQVLSDPKIFDHSLAIVTEDPNCQALIIQFANRSPQDLEERLEDIAAIVNRKNIPVVVTLLGDRLPPQRKADVLKRRFAVAEDPAEAVRILKWLYIAQRAKTRRPVAGARSVPAYGAGAFHLERIRNAEVHRYRDAAREYEHGHCNACR